MRRLIQDQIAPPQAVKVAACIVSRGSGATDVECADRLDNIVVRRLLEINLRGEEVRLDLVGLTRAAASRALPHVWWRDAIAR